MTNREMKKPDHKLVFLGAAFVAFYVLANILATKKIGVGGLVLTGGLLCFPITFLITDIVNEVYGKFTAQKFVYYGFTIMALAVGIIHLAIYLPAASFWTEQQKAFAMILGGTFRITMGSMVAFLISQSHDIWAFNFWKNVTKGKHLWIRNNLSTVSSQIIDSVIFITVAFWGIVPPEAILPMITGQWAVKWAIAALDTPLCYIGVAWAKRD